MRPPPTYLESPPRPPPHPLPCPLPCPLPPSSPYPPLEVIFQAKFVTHR